MCSLTGDLLLGLVGRESVCVFVCAVCSLTGDLLSGLVGRESVCVCVFPDRRPAFGSCRQGGCVCF